MLESAGGTWFTLSCIYPCCSHVTWLLFAPDVSFSLISSCSIYLTYEARLTINYPELMFKCNSNEYRDTVMFSLWTRYVFHKTQHGSVLYTTRRVSPPVPLVETLFVRRLLSSLELPSLPLVTMCWGLVNSCISNDLPTNNKLDQTLQKQHESEVRLEERRLTWGTESPPNTGRNMKQQEYGEEEEEMNHKNLNGILLEDATCLSCEYNPIQEATTHGFTWAPQAISILCLLSSYAEYRSRVKLSNYL